MVVTDFTRKKKIKKMTERAMIGDKADPKLVRYSTAHRYNRIYSPLCVRGRRGGRDRGTLVYLTDEDDKECDTKDGSIEQEMP